MLINVWVIMNESRWWSNSLVLCAWCKLWEAGVGSVKSRLEWPKTPCPIVADGSVGGDNRAQISINSSHTQTQNVPVAEPDPASPFTWQPVENGNGQSAEETCSPHRCSLQWHGDRKRWENALEYTVRMKPCDDVLSMRSQTN